MLVVGLTFKENWSDQRNTRVVVVVAERRDYGVQVDVHAPWVDPAEAKQEYGLDLVKMPELASRDGVILAVGHDSYDDAGATALRGDGASHHVFCDLKSIFTHDESNLGL